MGRAIAISDIHGHLDKFEALLEKLKVRYQDRVYLLGDYIDRGPDSKGVVDRIIELRKYSNLTALRGNHEQMMLEAAYKGIHDDFEFDSWLREGGQATLDSYGIGARNFYEEIPRSHKEFFGLLRDWSAQKIAGRHWFFVHAGFSPFKAVRQQCRDGYQSTFLWERDHLKHPEYAERNWEGEITVVSGHTPQKTAPVVHRRRDMSPTMVAIDAGVHAYGRLIALVIEDDGSYYRVEA